MTLFVYVFSCGHLWRHNFEEVNFIKCTQNRCFIQNVPCTVVTKISSCQVNTTSRRGIKTARDFFWFYFSSIFLWKSEPGAKFVVAWENPWSPPLNDSPGPGHWLIRNLSFCGSFRRSGEECVQMFIGHHVWTNVCVSNNKFAMYCTRGITLNVSLETRINWWKHKIFAYLIVGSDVGKVDEWIYSQCNTQPSAFPASLCNLFSRHFQRSQMLQRKLQVNDTKA